jgi:hypothetical protein
MWHKLVALYKTHWWIVLILFGVASILFLFAEIAHDRFKYHDFEVYYKAGGRILAGENLYRPLEDGFYRYLYTPTAAIYFIPLALLPFPVAKVIYWLFLTGLILVGFYLSLSLVYPDFRRDSPARINTILLLAGLILGVHIQRELHLGQVNHLLLVMYLSVAYLFGKQKPVWLALIWAASIFIKPLGLILLPYMLIKKRFKVVGFFLLFAVLLFLVPGVFYDWVEFVNQLDGSLREIKIELAEKQDLFQPGNHTIFSVLIRYSPLRFVRLTPFAQLAYQGSILGLLSLGVLWIILRGKQVSNSEVLELALLIGLIPLLAFTSYNAFGFIQVIVFMVLVHFHTLGVFEKIGAITGFLLTGGNWYDLWGRRLWKVFEAHSLIAIGAIVLICVLCSQRIKGKL